MHRASYMISYLYFPPCIVSVPPSTSVMVTSAPASPIRPVESDVILTCTVELSTLVDVSVIVTTVWTGPAGFRYTNTAQPAMGSTSTYISTATVSSFGRDESGIYTCVATVSSVSSFLRESITSTSTRVTVGKVTFIQIYSPAYFTLYLIHQVYTCFLIGLSMLTTVLFRLPTFWKLVWM